MEAGRHPPSSPEGREDRGERIAFQVEVEAGVDPIRGSIHSDGQELDFVGWMGLAGALERILDTAGTSGPAKSQG